MKVIKRLLCSVFLVLVLCSCTNQKTPLRICVDLSYLSGDNVGIKLAVADFESSLKNTVGITDFVVEYVPETGSERETALDRIRTEIMSGNGPDVFIMHCKGADYGIMSGDALFLQPEKSMETGLFLPLDEYIEEAQYAEWDQFTKVIMDAGKNGEGQQLIPLTYTVPTLVYRADDFTYEPKDIAWEDMLNSEDLYVQAALLGDGFEMKDSVGGISLNSRLDYLLGRLADYEQEQLLFTEEELKSLVLQTFELQKYSENNYLYDTEGWLETCIGVGMNTTYDGYRAVGTMNGISEEDTLSFVPIVSRDGGCTAMVLTFAAVNRNTQRPEDAFRVIDCLLMTGRQQNSELFRKWIYRRFPFHHSMPIHEKIMSEDAPVFRDTIFLSDKNFAPIGTIRDQISNVQFAGQLNQALQNMTEECRRAEQSGEDYSQIIHEAYETMDRMMGE